MFLGLERLMTFCRRRFRCLTATKIQFFYKTDRK
jgi:hypothetical protein